MSNTIVKRLDEQGLRTAFALLKELLDDKFDEKADTSSLAAKQDVLTAGSHVTIALNGGSPVISVSFPEASASVAGLMSISDKTKLDNIPSGAEANVQSDWNQSDSNEDDYIKNKPDLSVYATVTALNDKVDKSGAVTGVKGGSETNYRTGNINITKTNIGLGNVDNTSDLDKPVSTATQTALNGKLNASLKGTANGLAELDTNGKVPSSQLPSYVDDVLEYSGLATFPGTGESGKIYVDTSSNKTYRWSGSSYTEISASLALGENHTTAYYGDLGKAAYDHASETKLNTATASGLYKIAATANGHISSLTAVTKSDITGLGIPGQDTTYTAATSAPANIATSGAVGDSTNYARENHTHGITVGSGDNNGQVKIAGQNVSVTGLGLLAYQSSIGEILFDSASGTAVTNGSTPYIDFASGKSLSGYSDGYLEIFFRQNTSVDGNSTPTGGLNSVKTLIHSVSGTVTMEPVQLIAWSYDSSNTALSFTACIASVSNGTRLTFSNAENAAFSFTVYRVVGYK